MPKSAPICRHCDKTYSKINEPIYMVCYCNDTIKYAHGSCFRNWLKEYKYGVCDECLTKTKIIPDEYKPVIKWRIPQSKHKCIGVLHTIISLIVVICFIAIFVWWQATQCYDAHCITLFVVFLVLVLIAWLIGYFSKPITEFWTDFRAENKYWKIVYCREVLRKTNSGKSIRRLSNVPMSISDYNENETKLNLENGTTSNSFDKGESNLGYHQEDSVFEAENIFVDHIFNPQKEWTPKSHLRIKKHQIHITDTFYASQSKRYLNKKFYNFENESFESQKSDDGTNIPPTGTNVNINESQGNNTGFGVGNTSGRPKTLADLENEMWESSNFYTNQNQEKGVVDDYIKSRAENFFNRRSSEKISPSDEYIKELRQSTFGSNSSVNSNSDTGKPRERTNSLPSIHSDILPEKKRKMSKTALFKKDRRSKFKRHRSLTSIEVTIDQEFTFDSYYSEKRSRSATSLATASEKDFRHLDIQVKARSRSVESMTSIKSRDICQLDESFTQERTNPMFMTVSTVNKTDQWENMPRTRDMAMMLTSLPYKRMHNQDLLDTYKSIEEKEIYAERREEETNRISKQFEDDPRKVLQKFQNDFDKSMTEKIDYDLGVYQIGQTLKRNQLIHTNYFNGTINPQKLASLELDNQEDPLTSTGYHNDLFYGTSGVISRPSLFNGNNGTFYDIES